MDTNDRPDDASDLFGYAPKGRRICPACKRLAEPYYGWFCWRCWATGDAGRKLAHPATSESQRDEWTGINECKPV